ncbi:MAG: hypothetical protein HYT61_01480 [Candidatus Yanofskybacteria bacterium]|nr:hypothetical protein [Candidatus Yanofskybacteria bacterium]
MLSELEEDARSLGIKDLCPNKGRFHPLCGNSPFRYGIKRNGTIVEWCTECGQFVYPNNLKTCPNCKSAIDLQNPQDRHIKNNGKETRIVCPIRE